MGSMSHGERRPRHALILQHPRTELSGRALAYMRGVLGLITGLRVEGDDSI